MGFDDLISKLERGAVTAVTAEKRADVTAKPAPALAVTAVTAVTAENNKGRRCFSKPPATHGEVLALYPGAVADEPIPEHVTRTPTDGERDYLLALLGAIYADDTEADRQEAIGLALADPAGALACYRAIAAERGIVVSAGQVSATVSAQNAAATKPHVQACKSCRHLARPGRADGYCAERIDLPHAYGADHPLRRLPADGGANCPKWAPND